ncbi:hypothetical protein BaRGS_00010068, partial [Batillaria attramentaria]
FPSGAESQTTYPTPSLLQGSWIRARDSQLVTFTSNEMSGPALPAGSEAITDYSLYQISGNQYLIGLQGPIQGAGDDQMLYFCWELVRITDRTYKLYELTPIASGTTSYSTHRVIIEQSPFYTKTVSDACTLTTSSVAPTVLYKVSSSSATDVSPSTIPDAVQDCPADVFATYEYIKDGTGCASGASELDFCVDRRTAHVDYTKCATPKIMYSSDGLLSCLTSYTLNSNVHILLINHDTTVDDSTAYRFVCMELDTSGGQEQATVYPKECSGSTSHSLALTRTVPIAVGASVGIVAIVAVVVLVVILYKVLKARNQRAITPSKPTQNGNAHRDASPSDEEQPTVPAETETPRTSRLPPLANDATPKSPALRS